MEKIKALICAFACDPKGESGLGSGEDILGWNIVSQAARFCDAWVLASPRNQNNVEKFLQSEKNDNLHFCYIDLPAFVSRLLWKMWSCGGSQLYSYIWQIKAYFVAKKLNQKIHFDIFHHVTYANDWMASFIGALLLVAFVRGPGGGAHKTPVKFLSEYSLKQRLWQYLRGFNQWIFRHDPFFIIGRARAKTILVCNKEALQAIPEKFHKKVKMFPVTGISAKDFEIIKEANPQKDSEKFVVLTAGKLLAIKGFNLAIKAFKIFAEKNENVKLIVVGGGPELNNLQNLALSLGIENKVFFEGQLPREKLLQKMKSADVFLFSSLRDGGGAVVVEAMGAGLPVVCLGIAGPAVHVDSNCGIKINPESPDKSVKEMADALQKLYLDKNLRQELGEVGQKKAKNEYSWENLGAQLQKIYEQALADNKN